jgi:NAD(P)-dependent dehydrogenase (short-subunit alcohol dehydrogenase family)
MAGAVDGRFSVEGKNVIITGGTRGLGRAFVFGLAAAGANVVVSSRTAGACEAVAAEARRFGVRAIAVPCHVGRWEQVEELVRRSYDEFGTIDGLVNNAGKAPVAPRMIDISEPLFDATVAVNLKGPFRLACLVGDRMKRAGAGVIVNISSGSARAPGTLAPIYGAAKAGLNTLTMALAIEYGPEVRVNAIGLGPTDTDASAGWFHTDEFRDAARRGIALKRGAAADEIVGTVVYLLSDASSFTSGAVLDVDGGIYGALGGG